MGLLVSIFVAFLILICILPIGIIMQRLEICAFKCLEKEWTLGEVLAKRFLSENCNLEYKLCKTASATRSAFYKRTEYRCYVPAGNTVSA